MVNLFTQREPISVPPLQQAIDERKNANNCGDIALTMELLAPYERWNVDLVKFTLIPGALYFENSSE